MRVFLVTILAAFLLQGCATPALHQAAAKGDRAAVEKLLADGAKIDQTDSAGRTALYFAAQKGSNEIVKLLLAKGADPTHRSRFFPGNTPVHIAAQNGRDETLRLFLFANIAPDVRNHSQQTPLMLAAWARLPETVALLLSRGAKPGLQDRNGWSALHAPWNAKRSDPDYEEVMELLIKHKAPVNLVTGNPFGYTPIMTACQVGSLYVVKMLFDAGAEINLHNEDGATPYSIAASSHNQPIMSYLEEQGAMTKPNFYGKYELRNPPPEPASEPEPVQTTK